MDRWIQDQRPMFSGPARARARDAAGLGPLDPGSTAHVLYPLRARARFHREVLDRWMQHQRLMSSPFVMVFRSFPKDLFVN